MPHNDHQGACHSRGTNPPRVEPTNAPIQMSRLSIMPCVRSGDLWRAVYSFGGDSKELGRTRTAATPEEVAAETIDERSERQFTTQLWVLQVPELLIRHSVKALLCTQTKP